MPEIAPKHQRKVNYSRMDLSDALHISIQPQFVRRFDRFSVNHEILFKIQSTFDGLRVVIDPDFRY